MNPRKIYVPAKTQPTIIVSMIQLAFKEKRCLEIYPSNSEAKTPIFEAMSMVNCKRHVSIDDEENLVKVVIPVASTVRNIKTEAVGL